LERDFKHGTTFRKCGRLVPPVNSPVLSAV
jgi:hypothetical protein